MKVIKVTNFNVRIIHEYEKLQKKVFDVDVISVHSQNISTVA